MDHFLCTYVFNYYVFFLSFLCIYVFVRPVTPDRRASRCKHLGAHLRRKTFEKGIKTSLISLLWVIKPSLCTSVALSPKGRLELIRGSVSYPKKEAEVSRLTGWAVAGVRCKTLRSRPVAFHLPIVVAGQYCAVVAFRVTVSSSGRGRGQCVSLLAPSLILILPSLLFFFWAWTWAVC